MYESPASHVLGGAAGESIPGDLGGTLGSRPGAVSGRISESVDMPSAMVRRRVELGLQVRFELEEMRRLPRATEEVHMVQCSVSAAACLHRTSIAGRSCTGACSR